MAVTTATIAATAYSAYSNKEAARKASQAQGRAADSAGAAQERQYLQARDDLMPFANLGRSQVGPLSEMLTAQGQYDYLQSNPLFNLALERADRQSNNAFLSQGLTGDARQALADNTMMTALPFLEHQTNNLFNAVNVGQASSAGQANAALAHGNNLSNLALQKGNVNAAGIVAQNNAYNQGMMQLLGIAQDKWG